jgi:hypothetical protein
MYKNKLVNAHVGCVGITYLYMRVVEDLELE